MALSAGEGGHPVDGMSEPSRIKPAPHAAAVCTGSRQDRRPRPRPSTALEAEIGLTYAIVVQKRATRAREFDAAILQHIAAMGDL
jgi:hypothetical protein